MTEENYIVIQDLCKTYKSSSKTSVDALRNLNFALPQKGMIFVIGKSGCGKSTLLNILGGLDRPTSGNICIADKVVDFNNESSLDEYRNQDIGFVFQDHNLMDDFNIKDNIKMSLTTQNKSASDEEIDEILKLVDLDDCKNKMPNEVSGGQRQRISIARTLIKKPKIILADEPTGNLDSVNSKRIFETLKNISKDNLVLVVTHDLDSAYVFGDRIIELKDGEIINDAIKKNEFDINKLKQNYKTEVDKAFEQNNQKIAINNAEIQQKSVSKSKLTFKSAFNIIFNWLKRGKVSLIVSVLILAIALGGFGVVNTITNYNYNNSLSDTLSNTSVATAMVVKGQINNEQHNAEFDDEGFTYQEFENIKSDYKGTNKELPLSYSFQKYVASSNSDYRNTINGICEITGETNSDSIKTFYKASLLLGEYPQKNDNYVEILISDYLADSILYYGTKFGDTIIYPNTTQDSLLNKTFVNSGVNYKIVGVYTCQYSELYKSNDDNLDSNRSYKYARDYIYSVVLTNDNAVKNYAINNSTFEIDLLLKASDDTAYYNNSLIMAGMDTKAQVNSFALAQGIDIVFSADFTSENIAENGMIISFSKYLDVFNKYEFNEHGDMISNFANLTPADLQNLQIDVKINPNTTKNYQIIGIFNDFEQIENVVIVNRNVKKSYIESEILISNILISLIQNDTKNVVKNFQKSPTILYAAATERLLYFSGLFDVIKDVIYLVIAVLFVFVSILMFSFISKSIRDKQKDIGIMRSLGANRKDIAKIFLLNDLLYIVSSFVIAVVIYIVGCVVVNNLLCSNLGINLALLSINFVSIILMLAVSVGVIALASIRPIFKYTKMAPIDVIRNTEQK